MLTGKATEQPFDPRVALGSPAGDPSRALRLMGIVNVTPDSFSDGGMYLDCDAAVRHGVELCEQGAAILDVGGESTRPGAEPVAAAQELSRVLPVIEGLARRGLPAQISIDTSKAAVAQQALAAGASFVNDVTALRGDPRMADVVAAAGADLCLMHMKGQPRDMQSEGAPVYGDVVDEVKAFLEERMRFATAAGIPEQRLLLDPGIGFGKTVEHNLQLLRRLPELCDLGPPVLVGTSRKSFLGAIGAAARGGRPVEAPMRLPGTIASNVIALQGGASVFRVHDVAPLRDALAVAAATLGLTWTSTSAGAARTS